MKRLLFLTALFLVAVTLILLEKAEQNVQAKQPLTLINETDSVATSTWSKSYGGAYNDWGHSIYLTADNGYIVAGHTDISGSGEYDARALKLDINGNIQWQKTYGGLNDDLMSFIHPTSDGGYIGQGWTYSFGAGGYDAWILKLDINGNIQWQKTYGGVNDDYLGPITQTSDGGYIVAGQTNSFGAGREDGWVLKLDSSGNIQWQKTYGGLSFDGLGYIYSTSDGGYIAAGYTSSFGTGLEDVWILKLDAGGNVKWQKAYGGYDTDFLQLFYSTVGDNYIVAGDTYSYGVGGYDAWILKLDVDGNIQWQKAYGGVNRDSIYGIYPTSDGGYITVGHTSSFGAGSSDAWLLKLDVGGNVQWQKTYGGVGFDSLSNIHSTSDGGYIASGNTSSFGSGLSDGWVLKLDVDGNVVDCNIGVTSNASVVETNATVVTTSVSGVNFYTVPIDTFVIPQASTAIITEVCPFSHSSCTIPYFSQRDPRWADHPLRSGGECSQYCSVIGTCGCTLTSATMVFNYYGADLTPDTLSDCMWDEACPFLWSKGALCSQGTAKYVRGYGFSYASLEHELNQNNVPVILGMHKQSNPNLTHWVVVISGQGTNPHDYLIHDPWAYAGANERLDAWTNLGYVPDSIRVYEGEPDCSNTDNVVYETTSIQPTPVLFSESSRSHSSSIGDGGLAGAPSIIANDIISGHVGVYHLTSITMTIELTATSQLGEVTEMQVWTDVNPNPAWQPFTRFAYLPVDEVVYAQFRDVDDNVSSIVMDSSTPIYGPPPDPYFYPGYLPVVVKSN